MVHATTGRERVPTRIGAATRTEGCGMVGVGIRTQGTLHTSSDQRSREENKQTSGGRVMHSNEYGVSVAWMLLPWTLVHPTRGERRQRETHDPNARRDPKEHRLHTSLCQGRRAMGMRMERREKRSSRSFPRRRHARWTMTSQQITTGLRAGTMFGMIECDGSIAYALCGDAARVQEHPFDARRSLSFMRRYAKNTTSWRLRVVCSWEVIETTRSFSPRRSCDGTWTTDSR